MSLVPPLGAERPLCFLHIPKTGGTSLTDAIARLYPPDRVLGDAGNLTVDYLDSVRGRLAGRAFIAGHPSAGVVDRLRDRADFITVLRRPEDHAVSNYLHVLSSPDNSLHTSASRQSFSDYLRQNVEQIYFQAHSLGVALSNQTVWIEPVRRNQIDVLLGFLDAMPFVGVIERADDCAEVLSRMMNLEHGLVFPCMNAAVSRGISTATLDRLRAEYRALKSESSLAYLFALEALVYAKAEATMDRLRREARVEQRSPKTRPQREFVTARRFSSLKGGLEGDVMVCGLADPGRHLIFGPYDRLPTGPHQVEFHMDLRGAKGFPGVIRIDVAANGRRRLAGRWLIGKTRLSRAARTLTFANTDAANVFEFRVRALGFRAGSLDFQGATVAPAKPGESLLRRLTRPLLRLGSLSPRRG